MAALLTPALRQRFAELGPQDDGDEAKEIVVGHFFLPGTGWDWYAISYDEDGGVPQLFCLVRGQEVEFGYVALAELESVRSPLGLAVERDDDWRECTLAELRRRLSTPPRRLLAARGGLVDRGGGGGREGAGRRRIRDLAGGEHGAMIERPANHAGQRGRTDDALDLWRSGERLARRPMAPDWAADYAAAVESALAYLQRYGTMSELVAAYFDLDEDAWLDALCARPGSRVLNYGIVEDAAYWRRYQELLAPALARR